MLAPWKKSYDQPRVITLPTKIHIVKAMIFPVWIGELDHKEGWAPKNWGSWTVVLRVPWTARRSNQSILKEISPEYSLEGLMLKLKLQSWCEELTHWKRPWCWERLKAGGEGDDRVWDGWMASPTRWTWVWVSSGSWWWTGYLVCSSPCGCKVLDMTEWLTWTEQRDPWQIRRIWN